MSTTATHTWVGPLVGSGTNPLSFNFQAISDTEVGVIKDGVEIFTGFTVARNPDGTGTITPTTSWTGAQVFIFSKPNWQNQMDFGRFDAWYPDQLTPPIDKLTRSILAMRSAIGVADVDVTTLAAGSPATVGVTQLPWGLFFEFGIPQGPQGVPGTPGVGLTDGDKGDITVGGGGSTMNIDAGAVTLAKMADMATGSLLYRKTVGSGPPEVQSLATLKTDLGLTGTNSGDQTITLTGNVTGSGTGSFAATIANNAVGLAQMADVATGTVFYRKTAATGDPEVQTLATLKTDLGLTGTNSGDQTITLTGPVTGSGTGSFATTIAAGVVTLANMADMATGSLIYRKTAAAGAPEVNTLATLKTDLGLTGTNSGDQTSIVGITGTKAQFNTAVTDGDILYIGDVTQYTDELAQDAVGAMVDTSLTYVDATPLLQRAALTGDVTAAAGSNATTIANNAVTLAKLVAATQQSVLIGRQSGSAGNFQEITLGAGLSMSAGGVLSASGGGSADGLGPDGDKGDVTVGGIGTTLTIDARAVTFAKMQAVASGSILYRKTAAAGDIEEQTLATLKTDLGLTGTNSGDQTITLTGDVTGSGTGSFAATIANSAVTLAKMADMATGSLIYRKTAAAGPPEVQTLATLKTDLGLTGTNSGDQTSIVGITGTIAQFNTAVTDADLAVAGAATASGLTMATARLLGRTTAASGAIEEISAGGNLSLSAGVLNLSTTAALATGVTGVTQAEGDNSTKLATTAYVDRLKGLVNNTGGATTLVIGQRGELYQATGNVTCPNAVFAAGDVIRVYNNSAASISIVQGTSVTMRLAGTATTGTRTLAQRGIADILYVASNECVVSGVT